MIGLRGEVDTHDIDRLTVLLGIHEVLGAEEGGVVAAEFGLLEVQVIVVVDRDDRTGLHQHVFCLMHLGFTSHKVRFLVDVLDELVVLRPFRCVGTGLIGVLFGGTAAGENSHHHGDRHQQGHPFSGSHLFVPPFFSKEIITFFYCKLEPFTTGHLFQQATMCPFPLSVRLGASCAHCSVA